MKNIFDINSIMQHQFSATVIVWLSYLVFPLIVVCIYFLIQKKHVFIRILLSVTLLFCLIFTWARFIEPQMITVKKTEISTGFNSRFALISDFHLGVFKDKTYLQRVVDTINQQEVDYVFIAGDFTYWPNIEELDDLFSPLKSVKIPVYAVLGNHDVEEPGPKLRSELATSLQKANVRLLENEIVNLSTFKLVGLGDNWAGEDDIKTLNSVSLQDNVIVLTHNPDTTLKFENNKADLTVAGHTHGGQIRIPLLYKSQIPTRGNFDKDFTIEPKTKLFISSGLGETTLPIRLFVPPVVDIIQTY